MTALRCIFTAFEKTSVHFFIFLQRSPRRPRRDPEQRGARALLLPAAALPNAGRQQRLLADGDVARNSGKMSKASGSVVPRALNM